MQSLLSKSYIIDNVKAGCNSMKYIQGLVCNGKSAELPTQQQLLLVWGQLDSALMHNISQPTPHITVTEFINILNEKWDIWIWYYNCLFLNNHSFLNQNQPGFLKASNTWQSHQKSALAVPSNYVENQNSNWGFQCAIESVNQSNNTSNNTSNNASNLQILNSLNNLNWNLQYESKPQSYHVNTAAAEVKDEDKSYEDTYQVNVQFNSSAHSHQNLSPFFCWLCHLVFTNSSEVQNHCLDWHDVNVNSQSQWALMQEVNYQKHVVNNVITIPQNSLTSHDYFTVEGLLFDFIN